MKTRVAVVGAGQFGRNHVRVLAQCERAELAGVVDIDEERARAAAAEYGCPAHSDVREIVGKVEAAIVAVPTTAHVDVALELMAAGIDVLVEKPIAADLEGARRLTAEAERLGRVLQVGHLERFNPAIRGLFEVARLPLFFEIHRMSLFSPRSLDVDVVLDLMIHDLDIVLALTGKMPEEVRAAGISVLSDKVDIANVRLAFPGGCIANFTASRVSTEKVRKLRLFQPRQYISLDYTRQDGVVISVDERRQIGFKQLNVTKDEPLRLEVEAFLECVRTRSRPVSGGEEACRALEVALAVLDKIEEHAQIVAQSLPAF